MRNILNKNGNNNNTLMKTIFEGGLQENDFVVVRAKERYSFLCYLIVLMVFAHLHFA